MKKKKVTAGKRKHSIKQHTSSPFMLFSNKKYRLFFFIFLTIIVITGSLYQAQNGPQTPRVLGNSSGFPHAQGAQIVDGNGNILTLNGAQIETSFNVMNAWKQGTRNALYPTKLANPAVFNAMAQWHMNELRLPVSVWVYNTSPSSYLSLLDQVITQANQAGLYVVLDLHDDQRTASPYADKGKDFKVATIEMKQFWTTIANHYKQNPMVMYDVLNEAYAYKSWAAWLHGGSMVDTSITPNKTVQILGYQDLVDAIRSTGSQQPIIVEAWQKPSAKGSFYNMPSGYTINDSNIIYSWHIYTIASPSDNPTTWNQQWGPLLGKFPLFVGEFAFLPNAYHKTAYFMCQNRTAVQGTNGVNNFLAYMSQNGISWSAWTFDQYHLIQNETTFAPTVLQDPQELACCGSGPSATCNYGMGTLIKSFLSKNVIPSPTYSLTPTVSPTPPQGCIVPPYCLTHRPYCYPVPPALGWCSTTPSPLHSNGTSSVQSNSSIPSVQRTVETAMTTFGTFLQNLHL